MESRFINKATIEYLKSKAGATIQQQINVLSELIDQGTKQDQAIVDRVNNLHKATKDNLHDAVSLLEAQIDTHKTTFQSTIFRFDKLIKGIADDKQYQINKLKVHFKILAAITGVIAVCLLVKLWI